MSLLVRSLLVAVLTTTLSLPAMAARPGADLAPLQASGFKKKRINLDLRGVDVQNVFRMLAKEGGVSVVLGPGVKGQVTMTLNDVLIEDAFNAIVRSHGLRCERLGGIFMVTRVGR